MKKIILEGCEQKSKSWQLSNGYPHIFPKLMRLEGIYFLKIFNSIISVCKCKGEQTVKNHIFIGGAIQKS